MARSLSVTLGHGHVAPESEKWLENVAGVLKSHAAVLSAEQWAAILKARQYLSASEKDLHPAVYVRLYPFAVRSASLVKAFGKSGENWQDGLSSLEVYAGAGMRLIIEHEAEPGAFLEFNVLDAEGKPL